LLEKIEALRAEGQVVVQELPNVKTRLDELNCDRKLVQKNGQWIIE
jgi:ATP phosphoribosyltransferase regulatory subunit